MNALLLDGTQLAYRSYYAFVRNPLHNSSGEETSLTFAFVNTLLRLLQRYEPSHAAVVFDAPGKKFRHQMDEHYKEGRPPMPDGMAKQLPRLNETLDAFRLSILQIDGYEADDILGTLARRLEAANHDVFLVTSDKDFQQLLSQRVRMLRVKRTGGDIDPFGPEELRSELGITPAQVVDYMSLCGDSVDNIPGVPGIGAKTAGALILEHGSLDAVFENLERISSAALRRKLEAGRDSAMRSRELVRLVTDVPLDIEIEALRRPQPDWKRLRALLRELEFFQLLRSLPAESVPEHSATCEVIEDTEGLQALAAALRGREHFALHVETATDATGREQPYAVAFAWDDAHAALLRLASPGPQLSLGDLGLETRPAGELPLADVRATLGEALSAAQACKIIHDVKQTASALSAAGLMLAPSWFDTMLASYVLNPSRRGHGLEILSGEFLDRGVGTRDALFESRDRTRDLRSVGSAVLARYMGDRVTTIWSLHARLRGALDAERVAAVYDDIELPLVAVLLDMERTGVRVDVEFLARLSSEFEARSDALAERIFELAGERFNIQSTRQLGEVLFERLGLAHGRRTKTGWSTDSDVLEKLSHEHELPRAVLEFRALTKLRSTYTEALPKLVRASSGRIHTSFNQAVASTGRLSSSDPNLQNIPTRTEVGRRIREAFVPADERARLLSADYSQIELRIMAHLSQDRALIRAFREGGDVHTLTAAHIAHCAPADVRAEQRAAAKTVNFGVIYGMGPRGLAQQLHITLDEARRFIQEYFASYPGVRQYTQEMVERARTQGFVTTLLGRRLMLPDLKSSHPAQRAAAERVAVNAPIQGSAADIIKSAMVRVHVRLAQQGLRARMILQVHDELVFDVPADEVDTLRELVREAMENALPLSVPVVVDVGVGRHWAEAH